MFSFWSYFLNKSGRTILIYGESIYNNLAYKDLVLHFSFTDTVYFPRSSRPEVFCKKRCSQKFRKIHRKTPVPEALFCTVAGLEPATLLKKRLWHKSFPVNFAKFLRTPFLTEQIWWLLLIFPNLFKLYFNKMCILIS